MRTGRRVTLSVESFATGGLDKAGEPTPDRGIGGKTIVTHRAYAGADEHATWSCGAVPAAAADAGASRDAGDAGTTGNRPAKG
jgi:hypothetical protein